MSRLVLVAALALASTLLAQSPANPAPDQKPDPAVAHQQIQEALSGWVKMNSAEKTAAVDKVVSVGGASAAHALAEKLHDKQPAVRKALAQALAKLKDEKSVSALAHALAIDANEKQGDVDAFVAICQALGEIDDAHAIDPLVHGVLSGDRRHKDWRTRGNARIQALGKIHDKDAIDQLLDIWLRGTSGNSIRSIRSNARAPSNPFEQYIVQGLQHLTGEKLADQKAWREWWKKHRAHFEFEKPKDAKAGKPSRSA